MSATPTPPAKPPCRPIGTTSRSDPATTSAFRNDISKRNIQQGDQLLGANPFTLGNAAHRAASDTDGGTRMTKIENTAATAAYETELLLLIEQQPALPEDAAAAPKQPLAK